MLKKKKKYLISSFEKLKYPKGSELFFIDEYLFHLQTKKIRSFYKCSYINSFDEMYKITYNSNILFKKKLKIYRKEIVNLLNSYHKTRYPIKYWGLIIDQVLLLLIQTIYIEVKLLSKIKEKNLICNEKTSNNFFFDNSINTIKSIYSGNLTQFLRPLVMKELGFKNLNLKYRKLNKRERDTKKKRYKLFLNFFIKMYLYLFKPILIVDGYLGLKNTIYLFFRSFGKILNIPKKILFDDSNENFVVDKTFRQNIKVQ